MRSNLRSRRPPRSAHIGTLSEAARSHESTDEVDVRAVHPMRALPRAAGDGGVDAGLANNELFALVYAELRRLAAHFLSGEKPEQTLQPTALVHEVYLRLAGGSNRTFENRAHFFGAAARAIRCILIDRARARRSARREAEVDPLSAADHYADTRCDSVTDILDLDAALGRLALLDPHKARVVELRYFGGLTNEETAEALGTSVSTVTREWRFARIWLHRELSGEPR